MAAQIEREVKELLTERSRLRDKIRKIAYWVQGYINSVDEVLPEDAVAEVIEHGSPGFGRPLSRLNNNVFIPRYYDPYLEADIATLGESHRLVSLSKLVKAGVLFSDTGIEIGKMAYGTGDIPFVRTSDVSSWELGAIPN